jgi:hypothetical protein
MSSTNGLEICVAAHGRRALGEPSEFLEAEHRERNLPLDQRRMRIVGQPPVERCTCPRDDARIGSNHRRNLAKTLVVPRLKQTGLL